MGRTTAVYDGRYHDIEVPWNRPITGQEIRDRLAVEIGQTPAGVPAVRHSNGELEHVGAHDHTEIHQGDSLMITPRFETGDET